MTAPHLDMAAGEAGTQAAPARGVVASPHILRLPTDISESDRRRVLLLAWVLVTLTLFAIVCMIATLTIDAAGSGSPQRTAYVPLIAATIVALFAAMALDISGHYRPAAVLAIACAGLAPWAAVAIDASILSGDFVPMAYVIVSILLSSILLSARFTAAVGAAQITALCMVLIMAPSTREINWPSLLLFVLAFSALSVVANLLNQKNLTQIGRQNRQLEESEALMREQSVRDHVTGLFNRRYLEETLQRELHRAEREESPVAVLMLDIDHFKRFNDLYGHSAGDTVLQAIGGFLRAHVREADIACRYGGEEFTLILPGAPRDVALVRAELLRTAVRQLRPEVAGRPLRSITLSLGVSFFPEHGMTAGQLLAASDAAMYRAKAQGRDRVIVAGPGTAHEEAGIL